MEKKITKREKFEMLKEIIRGDVNVEMTVEQAELIDFLDAQIVAIDTKAEKAKAGTQLYVTAFMLQQLQNVWGL